MKYEYNFSSANDENYGASYNLSLDQHDLWDMPCTLAPIILPMLNRLKTQKAGTPFTDNKDAPKELRLDAEHQGFNEERWQWIIDQMIFSFTHVYRCQHDDSYDEDYACLDSDSEVNLSELHRFNDTVDNGFRLFGKYFQNLRL